MATHSSVLAWRIPGTGEPGGVAQSRTRLKRLSSSSSRGRSYGKGCWTEQSMYEHPEVFERAVSLDGKKKAHS